MGLHELNCKICFNRLEFKYKDDNEIAYCVNCKREFRINEITKYAVAGSGTEDWYEWNNDTIIKTFFYNISVDILEKTWEKTNNLNKNEKKPPVLLPLLKDYHEAIRKRLQIFLTLPHITLTQAEKDNIANNPDSAMLNIHKLFNYLKNAIPITEIEKTRKTEDFLNNKKSLIKKLIWIRNKELHISPKNWPLPSYIHGNKDKNPSDISDEILNKDFVIKINNFVVDVIILTFDIDPNEIIKEQYDEVERYRIIIN